VKKTKTGIIKVGFALMAFSALGSGQSPPDVGQESGAAPCSNIVAIAGATVNCSNLTPEQRKMIEAIPGLLKKMLTNQLDPAAVNAALDQIKKHMDGIGKTLEKHDAGEAERRETEERPRISTALAAEVYAFAR
jgi:hypothetical protein